MTTVQHVLSQLEEPFDLQREHISRPLFYLIRLPKYLILRTNC
jgi:hypothetical protein